MAEAEAISFVDALHERVDDILDACTRCGKCVIACPMVEPAGIDTGPHGAAAPAIVGGILDLLAGGEGTADARRWAEVCTNSGRCIPACDYGVNPRFMVNMARIAAKEKLGQAEVRRAAHRYFTTMSRSTRVISRLQLAPELLARINPPLRDADDYSAAPDIVFYTGCNVIKTPHIALLVLEVLDALGVSYEVMGGAATCCASSTSSRVMPRQPAAPPTIRSSGWRVRVHPGLSHGARAARSRSARSRYRPTRDRSAICRSTSTRSLSSSPSGSTI